MHPKNVVVGRQLSLLGLTLALVVHLPLVLAVESKITETSSADGPVFHSIDKVEKQGIVIELAVDKVVEGDDEGDVDAVDPSASPVLRAGDNVRFRFHAYDKASNSPLSGAFPAAWAHPRATSNGDNDSYEDKVEGGSEAKGGLTCQQKTENFIGGSLFSRADVDLNTYYVMALNDDASISVVDPLFGFGGSKLLTMLPLPAVGYDWSINKSQSQVIVSIPATDQLVKIDTVTWAMQTLQGGEQWQRPMKLVLQDDQRYLWAAVKLADGKEGVAAFDPESLTLEKTLETGKGILDITLSADGRFVFVLNSVSETLSVINSNQLEVVATLPLGEEPAAMAFSTLADALYITHRKNGRVIAIDASSHRQVAEMTSEPGLGDIGFSPEGRWGFTVNAETNRLSIIDVSKNRIVQSNVVEQEPLDISFSENLAYIRHRGSATLLMITLADESVGREGVRIPAVDTVGGDTAPGLIEVSTAAVGIVQAPGSNAVLIANYGDQSVYFYKEGMAAPMGQFQNYGRSPRAVLAVDRSLREIQQPGIYESTARLTSAGLFDVVYFMDSPRIVHCFTLQVKPQENLAANTLAKYLSGMEILETDAGRVLNAGSLEQLVYLISGLEGSDDHQSNRIDVLITSASGLWRERQSLMLQKNGPLALHFTPPSIGYYRVTLQMKDGRGDHTLAEFLYQAI